MEKLTNHLMVLLGVVWLAGLASIVPPDLPVWDGLIVALPGLMSLACGLLPILED